MWIICWCNSVVLISLTGGVTFRTGPPGLPGEPGYTGLPGLPGDVGMKGQFQKTVTQKWMVQSHHLHGSTWNFEILLPLKPFESRDLRKFFRGSKMSSSPCSTQQLEEQCTCLCCTPIVPLCSRVEISTGTNHYYRLVGLSCSPVVTFNANSCSQREGSFCRFQHRSYWVSLPPRLVQSSISLKLMSVSSEKIWLTSRVTVSKGFTNTRLEEIKRLELNVPAFSVKCSQFSFMVWP